MIPTHAEPSLQRDNVVVTAPCWCIPESHVDHAMDENGNIYYYLHTAHDGHWIQHAYAQDGQAPF